MNRQKELENIRQKSIESWASAQKKALHEAVKNTPVAPPAQAAAGTGVGAGGSFSNSNEVYYLRWSEGEPWNEDEPPTNVQEMNAVFGIGGWSLAFFENLDFSSVFSSDTKYIFMDGSDASSIVFYNFYYGAYGVISNWVYNGGKLFVNAAPNVGGNMNLGFGGLVLNFVDSETGGTFTEEASITTGSESHPIFNGPGVTGTNWTGNSFAHAYISGNAEGLIKSDTLGTQPPAQVAVEVEWGSGKVIAGGMTL